VRLLMVDVCGYVEEEKEAVGARGAVFYVAVARGSGVYARDKGHSSRFEVGEYLLDW
jgi:hypothetical protein